jgi:3-keto-disaccharide hydrolase
MMRVMLFLIACAAFAQQEPAWQSMFDGQTLKGWKETPFTGKGTVKVQDGCIVLGKGYMTGVNYTGTLPKANYEVRMEAQRVEGHDFFAGITFPVNDSFLTWINGGWGGSMIGLSSLDGNDASENETSLSRDFKAGQWYRFWFAVNTNRVRAWIDDELVIDVQIANREVALRPGEIELSKPFGVAAYDTASKLRKIEWRPLPSK